MLEIPELDVALTELSWDELDLVAGGDSDTGVPSCLSNLPSYLLGGHSPTALDPNPPQKPSLAILNLLQGHQ